MKSKGLVPSCGRGLSITTERLSRFVGRGGVFALHRCHSSSLPDVNKSHRNKQEGQNETEKELAVVDHDLIDDVNANVKWIVGGA
jgi:hypothetical protein